MDNLSLIIVLKLSYNKMKINNLHFFKRPYFYNGFEKNPQKSLKTCTFHGKDPHN